MVYNNYYNGRRQNYYERQIQTVLLLKEIQVLQTDVNWLTQEQKMLEREAIRNQKYNVNTGSPRQVRTNDTRDVRSQTAPRSTTTPRSVTVPNGSRNENTQTGTRSTTSPRAQNAPRNIEATRSQVNTRSNDAPRVQTQRVETTRSQSATQSSQPRTSSPRREGSSRRN